MTALIKYDAACKALAECKAVDEVKEWADKAAAMQAYGRMAKDKTLEIDAGEIRLRAERRLGQMLAQQKADGGLSKGAAGIGLNQHTPNEVRSSVTTAPTLSDAGISKDLSSRSQKLAAIPDAEFEEEVGEWRDRVSAEGARVSARLEKKGEKHLQQKEHLQLVTPTGEVLTAADMGADDPLEMLKEMQQDLEAAHKQIEILTQDDTKAELHKMILQRDHAVRRQSEEMDKAFASQKREKRTKALLMRCGKAVGEDDPEKIPATVEAMARTVRKAA